MEILSILDLIKQKGMSIYDMTFAFSSQADEEKREELLEKIESFIRQNQGRVEKINQLGKRKFAYEVNKEKEGFFVTLVFQAKSTVIGDIYKFVNSEDFVIKLMLVKKKRSSLKNLNQEGEKDVRPKQSDTDRQLNSRSGASLHA